MDPPHTDVVPTILSEARRNELRKHVENNTEAIQETGKLLSTVLGKDHRLLTALTFKFTSGETSGTVTEQERIKGYTCCATYSDGSCGCVADPPGISYPC